MTPHDSRADVPDLLAMKQASMVRMLASAKALHEEGELRPMPLPTNVSPPLVEPIRVKSNE